MHMSTKLLLYLLQLCLHAFARCLSPKLETGARLLGTTDVCEPKEIKRFRFSKPTRLAAFGSILAEFQKACLLRMETQTKRFEPLLEIAKKALCFVIVLKPDNRI